MDKYISVALWTHPRSMSTVFERYFIERQDFEIFHEEFSYVFNSKTHRTTLPHAELDNNHLTKYAEIRDHMENNRKVRPIFHKDMCYHTLNELVCDPQYLSDQINIFLVRDPKEAILSLATINPNLNYDTLGYAEMPVLYGLCHRATDKRPLVIDSSELANNPEETYRRVCSYIGIEFNVEALSWESGIPEQWNTWPLWHKEASRRTSIGQPSKKYSVSYETHPELVGMVDYCLPFYQFMKQLTENNKKKDF